jgi:serine/threonine-protein kinase
VAPTASNVPSVDEPRRGNGVFIGLLILLLIGLGVALFYVGTNLSARESEGQVVVPTVVEMVVEEAEAKLRAVGFEVRRIDEANDQKPPGIVFDQNPKGQSQADPGSIVEIRVSTGAGNVTVPQLVGTDQNSALSLLTSAGFEPVTETEPDQTVPAGFVKAQDPPAGTELPQGSKVTIVVSAGQAEVDVPDVSGQTATAASSRLTQLGFQVAQQEERSDSIPRGRVIRTSPKAGTEVEEGSTVTLIVSSGPESTTTTTPTTAATTTTTATTSTTSTTTAPTTTTSRPSTTTTTARPSTTSTTSSTTTTTAP